MHSARLKIAENQNTKDLESQLPEQHHIKTNSIISNYSKVSEGSSDRPYFIDGIIEDPYEKLLDLLPNHQVQNSQKQTTSIYEVKNENHKKLFDELDKKNLEWESVKYDLNEDIFFHKVDKYQEKLKQYYKDIRARIKKEPKREEEEEEEKTTESKDPKNVDSPAHIQKQKLKFLPQTTTRLRPKISINEIIGPTYGIGKIGEVIEIEKGLKDFSQNKEQVKPLIELLQDKDFQKKYKNVYFDDLSEFNFGEELEGWNEKFNSKTNIESLPSFIISCISENSRKAIIMEDPFLFKNRKEPMSNISLKKEDITNRYLLTIAGRISSNDLPLKNKREEEDQIIELSALEEKGDETIQDEQDSEFEENSESILESNPEINENINIPREEEKKIITISEEVQTDENILSIKNQKKEVKIIITNEESKINSSNNLNNVNTTNIDKQAMQKTNFNVPYEFQLIIQNNLQKTQDLKEKEKLIKSEIEEPISPRQLILNLDAFEHELKNSVYFSKRQEKLTHELEEKLLKLLKQIEFNKLTEIQITRILDILKRISANYKFPSSIIMSEFFLASSSALANKNSTIFLKLFSSNYNGKRSSNLTDEKNYQRKSYANSPFKNELRTSSPTDKNRKYSESYGKGSNNSRKMKSDSKLDNY